MPDWPLEAITPQDLGKILTNHRSAFKRPSPFIESRVFSCRVAGRVTSQRPVTMRW
jgi:hypothetical protein